MEAVGAASAILQIATAGIQCTVKLVAFAGQMKTAPERINHIAEDVSLNASILQQLGELIRESKGDGTSRQDNCSEGEGHKVFKSLATDGSLGQKIPEQGIFNALGLETILKLASRCSRLFDSLSESLRNASQQLELKTTNAGKVKLSRVERLKWPFLKPEMDTIRDELKDTKGTLMLMLQVATLAYSRNMTQSDNANKTTIITYSEEDQHLLVRSIVAAHRSRETLRISDAQTTIGDVGRTEPVNPGRGSESIIEAAEEATRHTTIPENQTALPPTSYSDIETVQALSPQLDSEHTEPAKSVRQTLVDPIYHDKESSGASASKPQLDEKSLPPRQSPDKLKETEYLIRVLSPQASLYKNKIHVVYQVRPVRPSPSVIETQIQQWKSSQFTLVDQLLQLTPQEHSALDAIESLSTEVSHLRPKNNEAIEWIHLGEYFPVIDGLDQIKARVIIIITTQWRLAPVIEPDIRASRTTQRCIIPVPGAASEDEDTSDGMSQIGRNVGAGALGPTAARAITPQAYYPSISRHRSSSSRARPMNAKFSFFGVSESADTMALARNQTNNRRRSWSRGRSRRRQRRISLVSESASEDEGNEMDGSINGDDIVQDLMNRYTTL